MSIEQQAAATRSLAITKDSSAVFEYVARPENLPHWAPRFATAVRRDGDDIIVIGDGGAERRFRLRTDAALGVVDFLVAAAPDHYVPAALLRIVPYGRGSIASFTLLRLPGEGDAELEARMAVLDEELSTLRDHFLEGAGALAP
jgi:hypothetical protein